MRASLLYPTMGLLSLASAVPVEPPVPSEMTEMASVNPTEPTVLSVPKEEFADIVDEASMDGWANITLVAVPSPPKFLFNFSTAARDHSVDQKYVAFFEKLHTMASGTGFNEDAFAVDAEDLKAQHTALKELAYGDPDAPAAEGVVEMFNTSTYFYQLMRYHAALLQKDKDLEFDKHDAKCVLLFMDQLAFEVSLIGLLGFTDKFTVNPKFDDPAEKLKAAQEKARSLEIALGKLFLEHSQVFEFVIKEFSRIQRLMLLVDKFVTESTTAGTAGTENTENTENAKRKYDEINRRSLYTEGLPAVSQNHENIRNFTARLDRLYDSANAIALGQLRREIDSMNADFEQMELHSVRWSKLAAPEVSMLYATLEQALFKLDELDKIYEDRAATGEDDDMLRARDDRAAPSFATPWLDEQKHGCQQEV